MHSRLSLSGRITGAALLISLIISSGARAEVALNDFAQPALRDFTATAVIVHRNDAELRKIDEGAPRAYRIRESVIQYKEPGKLRVDTKAGFLSVRYVINGKRKATQVPGLGVNKVKDITGRPGEEQGMLDSGILTPAFLADAVASKFLRYETMNGRKVPVFELWYTDEKHSRRHFVWLDPEKRIVLRHDVHHRRGGVKKWFLLKEPKQFAGVWVPTRIEVYNAENRLAAVTRYSSVKVNTGLSESLFRI